MGALWGDEPISPLRSTLLDRFLDWLGDKWFGDGSEMVDWKQPFETQDDGQDREPVCDCQMHRDLRQAEQDEYQSTHHNLFERGSS